MIRLFVLLLLGCLCAQALERLKVGDRLPELNTGRQVFHNVLIRSITARTVSFSHEGGLASLPLHSLPEELRLQLGYDSDSAAAAEAAIQSAKSRESSRQRSELEHGKLQQKAEGQRRYETLLQNFALDPEMRAEVDLRQRFFELDLGVKSQGRRPSCAIFAVVSALEYLNAEVARKPERLSEEYLIWATRHLLRRGPPPEVVSKGGTEEDDSVLRSDEGFDIGEVMSALRGYGIPLQESMPNTFGSKLADIPDPPEALIDQARTRRQVFVHQLPGRDPVTVVGNLVHILNAGIPVPIGLRWPHYRTIRQGLLSEQKPVQGYQHAVTLVGYRCPTGRLEDCTFIFKNSYGADWGQGGYGQVTYAYLSKHLLGAALLEVQDR